MTNVFIDGKEGTTGLQIYERLGARGDVHVVSLPDEQRKDPAARKECINAADIVFLCLPDAAAKESVSLCENERVRIIDASTAHRTDPAWAYGFPELSAAFRKKIAVSKRVAVPGCHGERLCVARIPARCGRDSAGGLSFCGVFRNGVQRRREKDDRRI